MKNYAQNSTGNFGKVATTYSQARGSFDEKVIDFIVKNLTNEKEYLLDVGCGTGIATRQLAQRGIHCVGCDSSKKMIKMALSNDSYVFPYHVCLASKMPFSSEAFGTITAFSSFHWFTDKNSIKEILRVLKRDSYFVVVNLEDREDFNKKAKDLVQLLIDTELPGAKNSYDPKQTLIESDFKEVQEVLFPGEEFYTPKQALQYIQSKAYWNAIPQYIKPGASEALLDYFNKQIDSDLGTVSRKFNTVVVFGQKI